MRALFLLLLGSLGLSFPLHGETPAPVSSPPRERAWVLKRPIPVALTRNPFLPVAPLLEPMRAAEGEQELKRRERLRSLLPGRIRGVVRTEDRGLVLLGSGCYEVGSSIAVPAEAGAAGRVRLRLKALEPRRVVFLLEETKGAGVETTECDLPLENRWWAP